MAVHLIGGGWDEDESTWTGRFLAEAAQRSRDRSPRLAVVLWAQTLAEGERWHEEYRADFTGLGRCDVEIVQLAPDRPLRPDDLTGADGIFIGGGLTPGYHEAVLPARDAIRAAVAAGVSYAGYSAGAMIAGSQALVGGWQLDGVAVCPSEAGEGLVEVSLAEGLGLVDAVVDVHCAQMGLLGRGIAIVEAGLAPWVIAVDECTSAIVDSDVTTAGKGRVWQIRSSAEGAVVSSVRA